MYVNLAGECREDGCGRHAPRRRESQAKAASKAGRAGQDRQARTEAGRRKEGRKEEFSQAVLDDPIRPVVSPSIREFLLAWEDDRGKLKTKVATHT